MNTLVFTYVLYSSAAIGLTAVLARTLQRHGRVFLAEVFDDNQALAKAINSLLVTGFYMLNLGYAFLIFRTDEASTNTAAMENLVMKLGALLLSLGVIHFVNMGVFWKIRRHALDSRAVPATFTALIPPPPARPMFDVPNPA